MSGKFCFYEFFAGGGMARAGLGPGWQCLFANDFEAKKAESYRLNWGGEALHVGDVAAVTTAQLPGCADLAWASFPCQDLSLAGAGAGLEGARSGSFWPFWRLMKALGREGRAPRTIVLENVCGALTSHGGKDFEAICGALAGEGYHFGALVIDAALFVPQSRPRLFIVAMRQDMAAPASLTTGEAIESPFVTRALHAAHARLPQDCQSHWRWWRAPAPPLRNMTLSELVLHKPSDVRWRSPEETEALIAMMSPANLAKLEAAKRAGRRMVGTLYRRTRWQDGVKVQRAEARFDGIAGCLRTPTGGSSRQFVVLVEKGAVRVRLMSARETARLMGLSDDYVLPERYNDAYHLTGDGVVVPVVRHIAAALLEPLLAGRITREAA
ncbi:MAG: DNA cytosine methyltransferase [Methylocystis sp.]|uniref:DNA cytosine methyltransferase n=1 Tax=Methylocystis sp. TaxID=1911079 RepID=UPI003DA65F3F